MPPASVGNISATSVGRVKDGPANCVKEKNGLEKTGRICGADIERAKDTPKNFANAKENMVVVGTVEDLSGKAKANAAELSGVKAEENMPELSGEEV
jgi:hypothetical protein